MPFVKVFLLFNPTCFNMLYHLLNLYCVKHVLLIGFNNREKQKVIEEQFHLLDL